MKNLIIITIIIFVFPSLSFAQLKHDYHWFFGNESGNTFQQVEGIDVNFNNNPISADFLEIPFEIYFSNATMSDEEGNLLFYTNGCEIANKNHEIMMNGDSLNPGEIHDFICWRGYAGTHQSCLAIPSPQDNEEYLLFHKALIYDDNFNVFTDKLYYSLIDMDLDGGLGGVVEKNIIMVEDSLRSGEMTAIKHSNGEDWWLINGSYLSNEYFTFLITPDTIEGPYYQNIGLPHTYQGDGGGQVIFSPDGTKYVRFNNIDQIYLYNFDRTTGLFSNFEFIEVQDTIIIAGCAISPNSQFLYASTRNELYQFDLEAADIEESKILIDVYDGFADPLPTSFQRMELGPDCRIYMNSTNSVDELHVIHNPDEQGLACNFEQRAFQLPSNHQFSMPHFPYYRMDTDFPICDSNLVVNSTEIFRPLKKKITLYPNPTYGELNISVPEGIKGNANLQIFSSLGQLVFDNQFSIEAAKETLDLTFLPVGIYLVFIKTGEGEVFSEKIQIVR